MQHCHKQAVNDLEWQELEEELCSVVCIMVNKAFVHADKRTLWAHHDKQADA